MHILVFYICVLLTIGLIKGANTVPIVTF